jgi:hypothetical protein
MPGDNGKAAHVQLLYRLPLPETNGSALSEQGEVKPAESKPAERKSGQNDTAKRQNGPEAALAAVALIATACFLDKTEEMKRSCTNRFPWRHQRTV